MSELVAEVTSELEARAVHVQPLPRGGLLLRPSVNRIAVGEGQKTWRDHLGNGLDRLRANWLSLTLVVAAAVVLAIALNRVEHQATSATSVSTATRPRGNSPAVPAGQARADGQAARGVAPTIPPSRAEPSSIVTSSAPNAKGSAAPPAKPKIKPKAVRTMETQPLGTEAPTRGKLTEAASAAPSIPSGQIPSTAASGADAPAALAPPAPEAAIVQLRLRYVRDHRDDGDAVFDELNKADSLEKVQAAVARARAWDRRGADLVGDYWGPKARTYYQTANPQSEAYFYPNYSGKMPTEQFLLRKDWMNLVRQRQLNLGELASTHAKE